MARELVLLPKIKYEILLKKTKGVDHNDEMECKKDNEPDNKIDEHNGNQLSSPRSKTDKQKQNSKKTSQVGKGLMVRARRVGKPPGQKNKAAEEN